MSKDVTVQLGTYDVVVVGAGIAGVCAAASAGQAGARVALVSAGHTFSGSSFYEGTWGLGLVGARDAGDVDDFVDTILEVGRGVADPALARALVEDVPDAITWLERLGVRLRYATAASEREYIPCFDHAQRSWHGIERASFREAMDRELDRLGVARFGGCELLDVRRRRGRAWPEGGDGATGEDGASPDAEGACQSGADGACPPAADTRPSADEPCTPVAEGLDITFYSREADLVGMVGAGAVVLATGGYGGLFDRTLTMPDVLGDAHAIALGLGAELVNPEFMQIMPGLVEPVRGVVFNEKTFRYARLEAGGEEEDAQGRGLLGANKSQVDALMEARSEHGPFTASRPDRAVDFAVAAAGEAGVAVSYDLPDPLPEFMRTYADWFRETFGLEASEGVRIAPYAHAANGGIRVDARGATGVPGLFACGECTGGMHGADRIGGLASANALVFGLAAGRSAAAWALEGMGADAGAGDGENGGEGLGAPDTREACAAGRCAVVGDAGVEGLLRAGGEEGPLGSALAASALTELRKTMGKEALIHRSDSELASAQEKVAQLKASIEGSLEPLGAGACAQTVRVLHALATADALLAAMRERTESRGAHNRDDFPEEDPALAGPTRVRLVGGRPEARIESR